MLLFLILGLVMPINQTAAPEFPVNLLTRQLVFFLYQLYHLHQLFNSSSTRQLVNLLTFFQLLWYIKHHSLVLAEP